MKSVSFSPLWDLKSRSQAIEKDVTAVPLWVRRSSGSWVRRPMRMILFSMIHLHLRFGRLSGFLVDRVALRLDDRFVR